MLDPEIIAAIIKKEQEDRMRERESRIQIPVPRPEQMPVPVAQPDEKRGVEVIDI